MTDESNPLRPSESNLSFEEQLILAEEMNRRTETVNVVDEGEELVFIEMRDYTTAGRFTPSPTDIDKSTGELPVKARGRLDTLAIITSEETYRVTVWIDGNAVVDNTWLELSQTSEEMTHVDAYHDQPRIRDGHVTVVTNYPFREYCNVQIQVTEGEITFEQIRVEILVDEWL